ncbi:class I SAM-dependent methyltransferase [Allobaculum mucilyticum]|uniref:class I SAM-dependent methyltransferase n=1 Tax=Allobaculum mucilyticum TaxID=2834459 RepID=UPI001E4579AF|nr:class I SAM-dependent methyltransferase [Allobaculum mucilyticum]UNT96143.1 class I SAM-dependent methyltransferase [Allobaculum mucilyticum]
MNTSSKNSLSNKRTVPGLSKRLAALADMLSEPVIADIGCDHGLVCLQAVLNGPVKKAYACDLREGPLAQAQENVIRFGLQDQIFCRLRNGLNGLENDVLQILIAGMGGKQIEEILKTNPPGAQVRSLLLSPHKDVPELREWLVSNGYHIVSERMIQDGQFYPVLTVLPPAAAIQAGYTDQQTLTESEHFFGVHPREDDSFFSFLAWQIQIWQNIEETLPEHRKGLYAKQIALGQALLKKISE